jgi:hypothetical protein
MGGASAQGATPNSLDRGGMATPLRSIEISRG